MTTDDELMAAAEAALPGALFYPVTLAGFGSLVTPQKIIDLLTRLRTAEAVLVEKEAEIERLRNRVHGLEGSLRAESEARRMMRSSLTDAMEALNERD